MDDKSKFSDEWKYRYIWYKEHEKPTASYKSSYKDSSLFTWSLTETGEREIEMVDKFSFDEIKKTANELKGTNTQKTVFDTSQKQNKIINLTYMNKNVKMLSDGDVLDDFVFSPNQLKMGSFILKIVEKKLNTNILALGDAGTGKTTFIKKLCNHFEIPVFYLNCAIFRDSTEWFGERAIVDGDTVFTKSPLAKFIESGNGVVIFDELNRTDEFTRGVLLSLFDDTREISVQDNVIKVGAGLVFYATANIGFGYTGTHSFDLAEFRRFKYLEFEKLTEAQEVDILINKYDISRIDAKNIVKTMKRIEEKLTSSKTIDDVNFKFNISKSLQVAEFVSEGFTVQDGFLFSVLHGIPAEIRMNIVSIVNGGY